MKKIVSALTILAALALSSGFVSAQTITANGQLSGPTSINPSLGYSLYWTSVTASENENNFLPFFVTGEEFYFFQKDGVTPSGGAQGEYALTVDGTVYSGTGDIHSGASSDSDTLLDTLTLGNTIPSSFDFGVFTNNQGSESTQITVTLDDPSGAVLGTVTEGTSSSTQPSGTQGKPKFDTSDDIYYSLITNAAAGDTLNIAVTSTRYAVIGGFTFDSGNPLVIPEPKTWALLFGGVAFLGFMMVRRRQQV